MVAGLIPHRWQLEAHDLAMAALRSGRRNVVQACTGSGKSILQSLVVRSVWASPRLQPADVVVVLCPTEALVEQLAATLSAHSDSRVGRWYGRRKELTGRQTVVCCSASLQGLADALLVEGRRCVALLVDECHRGLASDDARAALDSLAPLTRLGFTATPWRTDSAIPGWDAPLLYRYRLSDALADGVVVPPEVVYWRGEDGVCVDDALLAMLAEHRPEGPGIVSAVDVADARATAELLTSRGWPAEAIYGEQPAHRQAALLEALRVGALRCLVHVRLLQEGVDLPWLRWLGMRVRRTALGQVQEVGRVLRRAPGKDRGIILDPLCQSPVAAFYSAEALGAWEAEAETETRPRDPLPPAIRPLPLAVAVDDLRAWTVALRSLAPAAGLSLQPPRTVSRGPATDAQVRALASFADRPHGACSRFPAAVRDGLRELCRGAAALDRTTAAELLDVLVAVGQALSASVGRHGWSRAWRWPDAVPLATLQPAALAALTTTA
jgi:hypothetical protein